MPGAFPSSLPALSPLPPAPPRVPAASNREIATGALALAAGAGLYAVLPSLADWLASSLGFAPGSAAGQTAAFFFFETPKVLLLLTGVVFLVGVLRSYVTPARARRVLAGRRKRAAMPWPRSSAS